MNTIDLLKGLQAFVSLLTTIKKMEQAHHDLKGGLNITLTSSISLRYSFVTLKIDSKKKEQPLGEKVLPSRYTKITFQIDQQGVSCTEVYAAQKDRENVLRDFIFQNIPVWNTNKPTSVYGEETVRYLEIADLIARNGYLCSAGDNYSPGYFSEIKIEDNRIILRQINRWNSKSLDHRDDYHMRDLEFFIPLQSAEGGYSFHDNRIGQMLINFTDHSSNNNKACGESIMKKMMEEKARFENLTPEV